MNQTQNSPEINIRFHPQALQHHLWKLGHFDGQIYFAVPKTFDSWEIYAIPQDDANKIPEWAIRPKEMVGRL